MHLGEKREVRADDRIHLYFSFLTLKVRRCTVVKLSLSKRSYMLLVLPHEGASLHDIELKLLADVMSDWHQSLQEG